MKQPIPVAENKLTVKEQNKARREAFFKLNVDLNRSVKSLIRALDAKQMEDILTAYMDLMGREAPEGENDISIDIRIVQQMALLASHSLSRQIVERYK